ncbi:hypothetical protein [Salinispira pacifica]
MNRIDRKFINWIFESTVLVVAAALVGHALDRLFKTRAQFLGLFLLAALILKAWQLVRLYRKSMSGNDDQDSGESGKPDSPGGSSNGSRTKTSGSDGSGSDGSTSDRK